MARMRFKNAYNYDSATRQLSTRDMDWILDETTDVGYAFAQVVDAAIEAGLVDFSENFIAENDLMTQAQADTLYELIGAVAAHVLELDPHSQYATATELQDAIDAIDLSPYSTTAQADLLYDAIGAAAAAVSAHLIASDPHTEYQKESQRGAADGYAPLDSSGDLPLTHLPTHTHASSGEGGTIAVFPTRTTTVITTASLALNAIEEGDVTLAAGYRLIRVETDRACRVRLYDTAGNRTADAGRHVNVDPDIGTDHGVVLDYVATAAIDALLSPTVDGFCPTGTTVKYSIENRSATAAVEVTLTWIRTE